MKRARCVALAILFVLTIPASAFAHGDVASQSPEEGATVQRVPKRVSVTLTETPVADSSLQVRDGCGRRVSEQVVVEGDSIVAAIGSGAQPGNWSAEWKAISAVDGHPTEGAWKFSVAGNRDCSEDEPADESSPDPANESTPTPAAESSDRDVDETPASASGDEDSGFPLVPLGLVAVAIVGLAVVARRAGAK